MSKKLKAVLILVIFLGVVLGGLLFILLRPSVWSDEIVSYLNDHILTENGWSLSIGNLDGQFTSDILVTNLYLKKSDGSIVVFSEDATLNLDFSQILSGHWAISELSMVNGIVTFRPSKEKKGGELVFVQDLVNNKFSIRELNLKSLSLLVEEELSENLYSIDLEGTVQTKGEVLEVEPTNLVINDLKQDNIITISDGRVELSIESVAAKQIEGSMGEISFIGDADLTFTPSSQIKIDAQILGFSYQQYLKWDISKLIATNKIDVDVELESNFITTSVRFSAYNSDDKTRIGQLFLDLRQELGNLFITDSRIDLDFCQLSGTGSLLSNRDLNLKLNVKDLDLSKFEFTLPTAISGSIELKGILDGKEVEELYAQIDLVNTNRNQTPQASVSGNFTLNNDVISVADSMVINIGQGKMFVEGEADIAKERVDFAIQIKDSDVAWLSFIENVDSLAGQIRGIVEIHGFWKDPSISGYLALEEASLPDVSIKFLSSSFQINSVATDRNGSIRIILNNGKIRGYDVEKGIFDMFVRGNTLHLANGRFEKGDDYFQLSGKMIGNEKIVIDQFQLAFADQYLTNLDQFVFLIDKEKISLEPAKLRLNEGTVEGSVTFDNGSFEAADLKFSNLELASMKTVLNVDYPVSGRIFGELKFNTIENRIEGMGEIAIKTGNFNRIEFDDFQITVNLRNNILYFDEFSLICPDRSSFQFSGFINMNPVTSLVDLGMDPQGSISITSEFRNFELNLLSDYYPESWSVSGKASGSLAISGHGNDPEMVYDFFIENPQFDQVIGKQISGRGRYTDRRLYFENLVADSYTGHYQGEGYLPFDLTFVNSPVDRFIETDPVLFELVGETRSLDFLSPYLTVVDSVIGDIKLELNISGTSVRPQRNGSISIKNGTIYTLRLDLPISNVNGNALITDNKFIIDELSASSYIPADFKWTERLKSNLAKTSSGLLFGSQMTKSKPNLKVTGSMDMSEFFRPNLAFLVTGKKVYVRTLLGEIEGLADLDLSITGKDTINIVGDIVPQEAILRMEFASEGDYEEIEPGGTTITNYKLHFPISGNLFIRNSQVNAELAGDMSIYKLGSGPYIYSGELQVIKGKYYYQSDVFDIQQGYLSFEPTEFNPKIDVEGTTEIEGVKILVAISGDLKEPIVSIEAVDSDQYLSQSDLLQLLTFQKRLGEIDMSTGGLRDQSLNILGSILENEFEKTFTQSSGLDLFEIKGSTSLLRNLEDRDLSVELGKRVSSNLYLSYKRSFSLTRPDQVGVEYRLNRYISLVGSYDEDGQYHLKYRLKYQY